MLRGVSILATTFLATTFLGFATTTFFLTTFFLGAGFLALVLDLLAVIAVFFFVAADVFGGFFLPVVVVAFLVVFFFVVGNARGALREKKRERAATTRVGDDDKVGSRPTRFVSVLRPERRASAWRTNTENMVGGVTALGWKKTKPRCCFDNWVKQWNKHESLFYCDQISLGSRCRWLGFSHPLFAKSACCVVKRAQPRRGPGQSSCIRIRSQPRR